MNKANFENINDYTSFQAFAPTASRWLEWQCKMISEVKIGTIFVQNSTVNGNIQMLSTWPDNAFKKMESTLYELAEDVIKGKHNIASKVNCHLMQETIVCDTVTLPLRYNNKVIGAVIFLQSVRSEEQKKAVSQLFRWGCSWLESTLSALHEEQNQLHPLVTNLTKLALKDVPVAVMGYEICNVLAEQLECQRVAFGMTKGLQVQTVALSHQLRFDKSASPLLREIEVAMEESLDQKETIIYPKPEELSSWVTYKHQSLSSSHEDASLLTIPFTISEDRKGAFLLLRRRNRPFTQQEVKVIEYTTQLIGSALALKLRTENAFFKLLTQNVKKKTKQIFGLTHLGMKMGMIVLAMVLGMLSFVKTDHYTYAKSSLEGAIQQVIVAPEDGFIESADVRAGDRVKAEQVLVRFNDRDLKLEREKLRSERDKITKEYREALALRERSKVSILSAQINQVDARLGLVNQNLQRSKLKSPFDGIVVSGDLSQSLGAPVEKGEQLFEISPLGNYRVAMNVDDYDISKLKVGQKGSLRLMGLPYDQLPIVISRITPVATAKEGGNYFRVEGSISDMNQSVLINESLLRPGMQGIAKVQVGEGSVLWVWTHTLFDRLRLWFWSIGF